MNKIIKQVDKEKGLVQITVANERWYAKPTENKDTKNPEYQFVPSVTWIAGCYPKGVPFYKWLADKGWDEAEAIKSAAGDKGSKVHSAIEDLIDGKEVKMDAKYLNRSTDKEEELTLEEWECLVSFARWFREVKPKVLSKELVVFDDEYGFAGTIDFVCEFGGQKYLIDFKTGQNIWPEYELQVSAYKEALKEKGKELKLAILQIGYRRNKDGYKFTEVEDKFSLFLAAKQIWHNEHGEEKPKVKDYPLSLQLEVKKAKKTK